MKKISFLIVVAALIITPVFWGGANQEAQAQAQVLRMRIQASAPSATTQYEGLRMFAERVQKMTGGRLKIEALPMGAVVGLTEILEAVNKGLVEGGYCWTHVWSGKHPAAGLFGSPPRRGTAPGWTRRVIYPGFSPGKDMPS